MANPSQKDCPFKKKTYLLHSRGHMAPTTWGIEMGGRNVWYFELGLHKLNSRPTFFMPLNQSPFALFTKYVLLARGFFQFWHNQDGCGCAKSILARMGGEASCTIVMLNIKSMTGHKTNDLLRGPKTLHN